MLASGPFRPGTCLARRRILRQTEQPTIIDLANDSGEPEDQLAAVVLALRVAIGDLEAPA